MAQTPPKYIKTVWLTKEGEGTSEPISHNSGGVLKIERRQNGDIWVEYGPIQEGRGDSDCIYMHRHWRLYPKHRISSIQYVEKQGRHACCGRQRHV